MGEKIADFFELIAETIQQDKLLHDKAGNMIAALASLISLACGLNLLWSALIGFGATIIVGVLKEIWFDVKVQKVQPELSDIISTIVGGFEILVIEIIIFCLI